MTDIVTFESNHGPIRFEVDESVAEKFGRQADANALTPKSGATPMTAKGQTADAPQHPRFESAMESLKAYAASVQDIVSNLAVMPKEVTVEVGLTLKGEAGFFAIAKAGTEAEMRVTLSWEPQRPESTKDDAQA